jgi:hypothetical protein
LEKAFVREHRRGRLRVVKRVSADIQVFYNGTILTDSGTVPNGMLVVDRFALFLDVVPGSASDDIQSAPDPNGFAVNGLNTRRVTGRNTPSVINAIASLIVVLRPR